ncbi:MAG TPA: stage 0 sporulation protein J [Candidatus Portnoybacteria bacterium]|uniref:Stage 0 sporulation protein J n=1 Tax=Candidatus Portnoybacteria bacterium CG02_land_8_20_14_3_00_45_8 TaxID=1974807 RepID=A0A2M7D618_9BACT|nr:MAG: stage 0 sporulation protein J [Candidatus Portnoybacteria bacterium CG02_land_8_20_14_3_00_45_8]HCX27961.1 stage 0 sporulation protein J [Candidatus Portnoybacteria bacterium]
MTKLGKGLQSLIPPRQKATEVDYPKLSQPPRERKESIFDIDVNKIKANPFQPRYEVEESSLKGLADSIKQHGILQPLIVTKFTKDNSRGQAVEYQLVAGHRRLRAAEMAGLPRVPAIIRDSTDQQRLELALVENIQRADLNAMERAQAFRRLQEEFDLTHDEIAKKVGKSREFVSNTMRLLNLPDSVQQSLRQARISEGHARSIAGIKNPAAQMALFDEIIQNNLSVRQVEQRAREIYVQAHKRQVAFDPEIKKIAQKIELALGKKVQIRKSGVGGRVMIDFESKKDLEALADKFVR